MKQYKYITKAWAYRKYGKIADSRVSKHLTLDAQRCYKALCVEGLAYLDGYIIKQG